jgi:hypothetical protein
VAKQAAQTGVVWAHLHTWGDRRCDGGMAWSSYRSDWSATCEAVELKTGGRGPERNKAGAFPSARSKLMLLTAIQKVEPAMLWVLP